MALVIYSISLSGLSIDEWNTYLLHRLFCCFALCWSTMSSLIIMDFYSICLFLAQKLIRLFCVYSFISYDSNLILIIWKGFASVGITKWLFDTLTIFQMTFHKQKKIIMTSVQCSKNKLIISSIDGIDMLDIVINELTEWMLTVQTIRFFSIEICFHWINFQVKKRFLQNSSTNSAFLNKRRWILISMAMAMAEPYHWLTTSLKLIAKIE